MFYGGWGCHKQHAILQRSWGHGGQDCLNPFTATREISKTSEEDTVKQITFTATFQIILMMVFNITMRMKVYQPTQFWSISMLGNKHKEIKETLYFIFC